jgi:hypothetical protein
MNTYLPGQVRVPSTSITAITSPIVLFKSQKDVTYSDNLNIYITPSSGVAVATRVESPIEVSMLSLKGEHSGKMVYEIKAINCGPPRSPR